MLKVHLNDGRTLCFDLAVPEEADGWLGRVRDPAFQAAITGLTVNHRGVQYSLPRPQDFEDVFLYGERLPANGKAKGGVRMVCQAGDVRIVVMVHEGHRAARVSVARVGKLRYNPLKG